MGIKISLNFTIRKRKNFETKLKMFTNMSKTNWQIISESTNRKLKSNYLLSLVSTDPVKFANNFNSFFNSKPCILTQKFNNTKYYLYTISDNYRLTSKNEIIEIISQMEDKKALDMMKYSSVIEKNVFVK